jgi:thiol-disulfide isomerase/thioredoxin
MIFRRFFLALAALVFSGSAIAQQNTATLPIVAIAPELHEGIWLNTDTPMKLATLRGKVVLLEMWTFGCINCIRTLPYVSEWHETYAEDGLVVIGNHYPEFGYEADLNNLRAALGRLEVSYPVLQDNDRVTWSAYQNRYWPTIYLIDKWGNIRYKHIGEGAYATTEKAIETLLAETYSPPVNATPEAETPLIEGLTPTEPLNVRSGPGTNFDIIGRIFPNEAYYIVSENNGWYQILFDGATAYVSGEYVILSRDLAEDS